MSASLGDMNERLRQLERDVLDDMVKRVSEWNEHYDRIAERQRRGHADPLTSDAEWEAELAQRRAAHAALMAELKRLEDAGAIIAYEVDIVCNEARPTHWLYDETVDEWHTRVPDWDQPVAFVVHGMRYRL